MKIREVILEDAQSISEIYNYYIENTAITFETERVTESSMKHRIQTCQEIGDPFYVLEIDSQIKGYAYIHQWDARKAYSSTKEITVYLHQKEMGKGYGTLLYKKLLDNIDRNKVHVLIAGICIPNQGSVKMHENFGFTQVSNMKEIGKKFGEWRDVGHWQFILNPYSPKILILCTGNSCRSQMAHGILQSFNSSLAVFSAGTEPAQAVHPFAVKVMAEEGINISNHTPEDVNKYINEEWDYVITVCGEAKETCPTFTGKVKNKIHIGFADPSKKEGTEEFLLDEFRKTREEIKKEFWKFYKDYIQ